MADSEVRSTPTRATGAVPVIIPTWNGLELLRDCLTVLSRSTVPYQIVVIDNGSEDGTAEWLMREYPAACFIRNERNLGFAAAVNQGIRATSSEWLALLNNDALPEPDWLEHLLAVGNSHHRIGSVASRIMLRYAPHVVNSAGLRVDATGEAGDALLGQQSWPAQPVEVFGVSGGACLYRRSMLDDIGLFAEEYFAYLEDVDLSWRALSRGWKAMLAPDAVVYHALSASAGEGSPFKRYYLVRNKLRTIVRDYPAALLVQYLPVILWCECISIAAGLVRRDRVTLRGRLDAWKDLPGLLRQRRFIQGRRTESAGNLRARMSSIESPLTLYRRAQLIARLAASTPSD